ncbi:cytochrome P450 [Aspergillus oleicola]
MGSLFKPFLWALCLAFIYLAAKIYIVFIQSPLSSIPGPRVFAITKWRLALEDYRGTRTRYMQILHEKYGAVVRIGPNEVSFNSLSALRTLYGAGTVFQRNDFYRILESILSSLHLLPMLRPTTYTGIRTYALKAAEQVNRSATLDSNESIAERLFLASRKENLKTETPLEFLDIASECADHLLAGIDTTSDTLMWAIFLLSQSENHVFQDKLREEIQSLQVKSDDDDVVNAPLADTLPYLNAIIKETLRLFPPLPGTEPRISETDQIVDGYTIPAGTTVSISPYTLHRNADVFEEPERFNPKRWLSTGSGSDSGEEDARLAEMKRWFWAFSSGGRMCIGMHLAMAEMTTLLASVYRVYKTEIASGFRGVSPGVTARYEVFYDDRFPRMEEHACWVRFVKD